VTENVFDGFWYLGVGAGRSFYQMDSDNYINPGPGWPNDHYYKNSIHDSSFVEANAGYSWVRFNDWFPAVSLGLRYDYSMNGKVSGNINQYNLGQFRNYSYSYKFNRQTLLGMFKLDIYKYNCFMPFVLVGAGMSYNKGSNYVEQPLANVTPRISPGYSSNSTYNFSYIVGAGIDYAFRDDIWATLEYNYGDFGNVRTGNGQVVPSIPGIDYSTQHLTNKIKANTLLLSFTYLLNYV
jgi:opacity protein-like surface antigen